MTNSSLTPAPSSSPPISAGWPLPGGTSESSALPLATLPQPLLPQVWIWMPLPRAPQAPCLRRRSSSIGCKRMPMARQCLRRRAPRAFPPVAVPAQVVRACRKIGRGRTRTYGELAAAAGSPGASRAVGSVMAKNRFPIIVPCHRVVGAGGSLGGFSAPTGLNLKERMLALEGHERKQIQPRRLKGLKASSH